MKLGSVAEERDERKPAARRNKMGVKRSRAILIMSSKKLVSQFS